MPDGGMKNHIAIETLSAYAEGRLHGEEADSVRRHLAECPVCGLALKCLERFVSLDGDRELEEEARWHEAAPRLESAFRERILPTAAPRPAAPADRAAYARPLRTTRWRAFASLLRWLVPIAAAAAVALVFFFAGRTPAPQVPPSAESPLRGAPVEYGITLTAPLGEVKEAPERFAWRSTRANDYCSVELFSADLKRICLAERVADTTWAPSDSLRNLFKPRVIYLWSVKGYRGLEHAVQSPNGWFKIVP